LETSSSDVEFESRDSRASVARKPAQSKPKVRSPKAVRARSSISNGRKLLIANGATAWGRRFSDLVADHAQDLGGVDGLTEAQIGLIRRAAAIECELERREALMASGAAVDLDEFSRSSGHLRRLWETLGLRRVSKDVTPTLHAIVKRHREKEEASR
jgi:hypothetical protein